MKQLTFQDLIFKLSNYWCQQGCSFVQGIDLPVGAATFHPITFFGSLGAKDNRAAYVQACRRPTDGRYGDNPFRLQHYYQFQVVMKPAPMDLQALYLGSLEVLGLNLKCHDVRFVEDNWESPTLGAWGLGWEVQLNGMEITQFTYFQQVGGLTCERTTGEIAYGLERLAMYLQGVDSVYDLVWSESEKYGQVFYKDIFLANEQEQSAYNFQVANVDVLTQMFKDESVACLTLLDLEHALPLAAYEKLLILSHAFNLLDARGVIAVSERQNYILQIRKLSLAIAKCYSDKYVRQGEKL